MPTVFQALEDRGTRFLRGQLALVAAGPGTGKSVFVLTLAMKSKVPTFYFSADSGSFTQLTRMVSIVTGCDMEQSAEAVRNQDLGAASEALADIPIRFDYKAEPTQDDLEIQLQAYEEVYGDYPSLIIVDNVTNIRTGASKSEDDPFAGLESLMDYLHGMARGTGACVVGLHHVTGPYNDADKPIPLSGVKGQITRVPEVVLTLRRTPSEFGSDSLYVSTVKNRGGKADASGNGSAELEFIGDSMTIRDFGPNHVGENYEPFS